LFKSKLSVRGLPNISEVELSLDGVNRITDQDQKKVFELYFQNIIDILKNKAKQVIVIGPLPPAITDFSKKNSLINPKTLSMEEFYFESYEIEKLLSSKFSKNNFLYIDLPNLMCNTGTCAVTNEGLFLYGDPVHFSDYGQNYILKPIFKNILINNL